MFVHKKGRVVASTHFPTLASQCLLAQELAKEQITISFETFNQKTKVLVFHWEKKNNPSIMFTWALLPLRNEGQAFNKCVHLSGQPESFCSLTAALLPQHLQASHVSVDTGHISSRDLIYKTIQTLYW